MLTLHDVLGRKVVDIVVEIFVSCCLLEGEVLGLDEAVQEVVLLAVLLLALPAPGPALLLLPAHNNSQDIEPHVDIKGVKENSRSTIPGGPVAGVHGGAVASLEAELPLDAELGRVGLVLLRPRGRLGTDRRGTGGVS